MVRGRKPKASASERQVDGPASDAADLARLGVAPPTVAKLRVFISWSGGRSGALAQALWNWLPLVLHYTDPFLSEADIDAGKRWSDAVASELEASNFGIICVTRQSAAAPWLLFEAGALAKSLEGSVIPLLLDIDFREITGPLAQFQAKKVDKVGLREVVGAINGAAAEPITEARLDRLFEALWPQLEKQIAEIPPDQTSSQPARTQVEVLEELVASVRSLDARMRDEAHGDWPTKRRRGRWLAKEAVDLANALPRRDDPAAILILASAFREDAPWIYDLAQEYYRALRLRRPDARTLFEALRSVMKASLHSRNAMIDYEDVSILELMERHLSRSLKPRGPPPAPPAPAAKEVSGPTPQQGDGAQGSA